MLSEAPLYLPVDWTGAEGSAKHGASWFVSAGDGEAGRRVFSNGCGRCVVSLENVGLNLYFQTHGLQIIIEAEFFLPLLISAGWAVKSSFLAGFWPFLFASNNDTNLARASGHCHCLMAPGSSAKVSQSGTCIEILSSDMLNSEKLVQF